MVVGSPLQVKEQSIRFAPRNGAIPLRASRASSARREVFLGVQSWVRLKLHSVVVSSRGKTPKSVFDKSGPSRKSGEARPDLREIEANSQFYLTKARADLDRFRRFCSRFTTFQTRSKHG